MFQTSLTVFGPARKSLVSSNKPCKTASTATLRSRNDSIIAAPISFSTSVGSPGRAWTRNVSASSPIGWANATADACLQAHVTDQNNCVGPFALCFLNRATNRFHWIGRFETAREFRPEPKRQARGNYADDGNADSGELFQNVRPNFSQGVLCVG